MNKNPVEHIENKYQNRDDEAGKDIRALIDIIRFLEKKVEVLSQQNLEISTEIEAIRDDFGGNTR